MKFKILLLLFFFQFKPSVWAGNPNFINYDKSDYQAAKTNWSISEDSLGVLYFGNNMGLLDFDGIEWTINPLPDHLITRALLSDSDRIYAGYFEELGYWKRGISGKLEYTSLKNQLSKEELKDFEIWRIVKQQDVIYFQSFNGIVRYQHGVLKKINADKLLFLNKVREELWVQKIGGSLYRLVDDHLVLVPNSEVFSKTEVRVILPFKEDQVLIATSTMGTFLYNGRDFKRIQNDERLTQSEINCGIQSSSGHYYIGTILDGIFELDTEAKVLNHFNTQSSMKNNTVLALYEDKSKNIWAALDNGISHLQKLPNLSCTIDPIGKWGAVFTMAQFANKTYLGTNQGLYYIDEQLLRNSSSLDRLKLVPGTQGQVWCLQVIEGNLYCGHTKGLLLIDPKGKVSRPYPVDAGVFSMSYHAPYLFLGTYTSLKIINLQKRKLQNIAESKTPVTNVQLDHLNNVWLEYMDKGIFQCRMDEQYSSIQSQVFYSSEKDHSLPKYLRILNIAGRALFLGNDLFYTYDDIRNEIIPQEKLNACFKNIKHLINAVQIDQNHLWVIGENIIYKVYYDGITTQIIEKYDLAYNKLALVDTHENIVVQDSESYICLDNGFLLHQSTQSLAPATSLKKPYLKSIAFLNSEGTIQYLDTRNVEEKRIPYSFHSMDIQFSSQDLFSCNLLFQYRLNGLSNWSKPTKINQIIYERLPKGHYSFQLQTVDQLGNKSEVLTYSFLILPPWTESMPARLGMLAIIIALAYLVWVLTRRRYKKQHLKALKRLEEARLRRMNNDLKHQVEDKDAEILDQTSFIIQKNELILKIKNEIDSFYNKARNRSLEPLYMKINVLLNSNLDTSSDWKMFLIKFEQKHSTFFKELKMQYPQLTSNDLKFCACLKINLDSKEISSLMHISLRTVENSRYRIRKKIGIPTHQNLNDFFMNI